jgi:hypothetical protein
MTVTGQTWIGRAARNIVLIERIHNLVFKFLFNIDQIEWDIEHAGYTPRIVNSLKRAAFILHNTFNAVIVDNARFGPEAQHDAYHLVPLLFQEGGGNRTIYAAAHRDDYACHISLLLLTLCRKKD